LDGRVHQYRILPDANGLLAVQVGQRVFAFYNVLLAPLKQ